MIHAILNFLFFRKLRWNIACKNFIKSMESKAADEFLQVLLKVMSLFFWIDREYRESITNFNARYVFKSKDSSITAGAVFKNGKLKVCKKEIDNTDITVIFKDQKALMGFLLSPKQDVLNAVLNQEVRYQGNLNYLSRFAYLATHLRVMVTGK